ncbi:multidrug resistance-like protein [Aaosphaeria arxii CBS 175.79]|uniref:Multidrug resistance-like protein n=1 Tax=Aaosphaeria arxii CBS 175.79 TaxID=1450172 RepID=A0A6A5XFS9_9PLEO|nr:multidrug resistance-like protein [Aaosphaeria arxii CBS 175.79]KAF2012008.1 multidrug resistance-like protein [Aaosphaeria arxii CBS 175.79]
MNETVRFQCHAPSLAADAAFGPIIDGCRSDFTFTFEQYFLSVIPSVVFLLLASFRVKALWKQRIQVDGTILRSIKLISIALFATLQLAIIILWATTKLHGIRTPATVASSLGFASSLALFALSYLEHSRSPRPSYILNAYLFISLLFDIVVLRTVWIALPSFQPVRIVLTSSFALKTIILFLEAVEKRNYLRHPENLAPEETSGLYSQTFLWWMNSIIRDGYRRVLKPMDLYPVSQRMSSQVLSHQFNQEWHKVAKSGQQPSLIKIAIRVLKWELMVPIFPRLALLGFTFCQPLLVSRLLEFLQNYREDTSIGYGMIGAYAVVYFGMSISNGLFLHRSFKFLTMLRGMLVSAIYHKTTELSITALDDSAAVTLMSADVERLILGLRGLHDLWANVLQFALAIYVLESRTGWACVGPIIVILATVAIVVSLTSFATKVQMEWLQKIKRRIGITSDMLGHMKGIKMLGLTQKLHDLIQKLRGDELKRAETFWKLQAVTGALAFAPQALSPVATFAFYAVVSAKEGSTLDAPRLFSSLALLTLLTQPLFALIGDLLEFRTTFGCVDRIEKYLITETRTDHRLAVASNATASSYSSFPESGQSHAWQAGTDDIELLHEPRGFGTRNVISEVVRIEAGSFAWSKDSQPVLHDINLAVQRSQLTMLIGPVASGKSTLLKAMLGETASSKGFVYVSEKEIAYCEQTPWLTNASVRENIIGFSNFHEELYDDVIYSCDLEQDIRTFPKGHNTLIGSKGISLSTGQKHRIAIARAVYARKSFAVFDDVFSGLDVNTQKNVFTRLFGSNGLLRKWNTTVLIATHAVNLLPFSDFVVALSKDGTVAEQGNFQSLNQKNGYVHKFYQEQSKEQSDIVEDLPLNDRNTTSTGMLQPIAVSNEESLDDKSRQLGDWSVYKYYFRTVGMPATFVFVSLACGWAFLTAFPTVWLKWYADANIREPNKHNGYYLAIYAVLQVLLLLDIGFLAWFTFSVLAKRSGLRLHQVMIKSVMRAPMSFFSKTDIGSITTRFSQDIQLLDSSLPMAMMVVAGGFLGSFAQIGLIASAAYYISAAFPVLFGVYFFIQSYYLRTSRQMRFLDLEEKAPVYTQFLESLNGLTTIRAFGWQNKSIIKNHTLVDRSQKPFYLMYMIQTWLNLVLDLVTTGLAILVVGISVKMRNTVSVGFTGVSLTQIISFTYNLKLSIMFYTQMETSIGAVARIKNFESETADENLATEDSQPPPEWPARGNVEVKNLTVSYGTDSDRKALDNISLSISAGTKFAIVGRTGSGKSTFLLSLFRMIEITSGAITIDGLDVSTIQRQQIRSRLNAIGEDPYFITGSIRLNLDLYGQASDDQLRAVLEKVRLWPVIEAKGGLDSEYEADMFSHGQVQIFALARALLRPGRIVVMDEVTSAVDRETDALMQSLIRDEFKDRTLITIAHRVDTIRDYDCVVVLGEGKVVECGRPEALIATEGSVFGDMVRKGS